jgi:signal transduction histidine kinase
MDFRIEGFPGVTDNPNMLIASTLKLRRSSRPLWWATGLALLALVAALSGLFYLIYRDWMNEQRDGLIKEMLWLEQSLRLQMQSHREWGEMTSEEIQAGKLSEGQFRRNAWQYLQDNPELIELQRIDRDGAVRWDGRHQQPHVQVLNTAQKEVQWNVSHLLRPAYSQPYPGPEGKTQVDLLVPLMRDGSYQGSVRLVYQLDRLLQQQVPWWIASKYDISVVDLNGQVLARKFEQPTTPRGMSYQINFDPPGYGLLLRAVAYRAGLGVTLPALTVAIILLTLFLALSVWRIRGHVTELRRQRLELDAAHERFLAVLNGLHAGVCVTRCDDGTLLYANPAFEQLWQVPELEAPYCPTLPHIPGDKLMAVEFSPDGGRRWFELDRSIISWVDGSAVWLDILADITSARERDARERAREERFQTTSRLISMGEMASSLAHELNQPLTAIRTYASGLVRRLPPEAERDPRVASAVQAIAEQSQRAAQIVASIRAFIKKHEPQLELYDPAKVVARALRQIEAQARKQGVKIQCDYDARACELQIDPVLIEQVVLNLVKNAVEAMVTAQTVRPHIHLSSHCGDAYWRLEVADNGPGLSDTMKANLFTPFYSTKPDGMGIGLNICRSIIEFHRGEFGANSTLASGCVFWFTLPLQLAGQSSKTAPEGAAGQA